MLNESHTQLDALTIISEATPTSVELRSKQAGMRACQNAPGAQWAFCHACLSMWSKRAMTALKLLRCQNITASRN